MTGANNKKPSLLEANANPVLAQDYAAGMFEDGGNPSMRSRNAEGYDAAVKHSDAEDVQLVTDDAAMSARTMHSRDGTDAVGAYDEAGGSLGGSEEEIDALEASHVPVDKTPGMKG